MILKVFMIQVDTDMIKSFILQNCILFLNTVCSSENNSSKNVFSAAKITENWKLNKSLRNTKILGIKCSMIK